MKNWRTTLGSVMTAISLIPTAIAELGISEISPILQKIGIVCAFISFIWTGLKTKDHNVSGFDVQNLGGTNPPPKKDEK